MNNYLQDQLIYFRSYLLKKEGQEIQYEHKIGDEFWDLTTKARFDIVTEDFERVLFHINFSIQNMQQNLPDNITLEIQQDPLLEIFWYYANHYIISISCGWDRLAILLDMAFDTNLTTKINIKSVLDKIPQEYNQNKNLIQIRHIQQEELQFLEGSKGVGIRHQATHFMTLGTRFFFEHLQSCSGEDHREGRNTPKDWFDKMQLQNNYLISGRDNVVDLIKSLKFN